MNTDNNGKHGGWSFVGKKYGRPSSTYRKYCPRQHEYSAKNLLTGPYKSKRQCRACVNADRWALRQGFSLDDPRTIAKAHEYYLKYIAE